MNSLISNISQWRIDREDNATAIPHIHSPPNDVSFNPYIAGYSRAERSNNEWMGPHDNDLIVNPEKKPKIYR